MQNNVDTQKIAVWFYHTVKCQKDEDGLASVDPDHLTKMASTKNTLLALFVFKTVKYFFSFSL